MRACKVGEIISLAEIYLLLIFIYFLMLILYFLSYFRAFIFVIFIFVNYVRVDVCLHCKKFLRSITFRMPFIEQHSL